LAKPSASRPDQPQCWDEFCHSLARRPDEPRGSGVPALTSPITSGQPDENAVTDRLARIAGYASLFKAAFPDEPHPITLRNIAKAVGAYERTLVTPSPFDAYLAGNREALPPVARIGLEEFINSGFVACHNGVASLRNVAMTPPYFHDGSVATLPEAVKVMARVQLGVPLNDADIRDIVAFLQSLTGELPANFATAPVLPSGTVAPAK